MMNTEEIFRCPVCRAKLRESPECSRCGADLTILLQLFFKAQSYRERARQALLAEDVVAAHQLSLEAQKIHNTGRGRRMVFVTAWLQKRSGLKKF